MSASVWLLQKGWPARFEALILLYRIMGIKFSSNKEKETKENRNLNIKYDVLENTLVSWVYVMESSPLMSCPNCHLRLHVKNKPPLSINPELTLSMTNDRGVIGKERSCPTAKVGRCDGLDDSFVPTSDGSKVVLSNVNAQQGGREKCHTPECLSSSLNSLPPCSMRTRNERIEFVSTKGKERQSIFLPLFLSEELSCHDFHEERIDYFEANSSESIRLTVPEQTRATPKLQLMPRLSSNTILNMRSPVLLCINKTQESDDDEMEQLETFGEDNVESRNSSPDDVLRLPFQSMFDKVSSRVDASHGPSESSCLFSIPKCKFPSSQLQRPVAHRHTPDQMKKRQAPINGATFSYISESSDYKSYQCSHWIINKALEKRTFMHILFKC